MTKHKKESVNHPSHYNTGKIEVIDFIESNKLGFKAGSIVKYVSRYKYKYDTKEQQLEDLKKAQWYLTRLITNMEKRIAKQENARKEKEQMDASKASFASYADYVKSANFPDGSAQFKAIVDNMTEETDRKIMAEIANLSETERQAIKKEWEYQQYCLQKGLVSETYKAEKRQQEIKEDEAKQTINHVLQGLKDKIIEVTTGNQATSEKLKELGIKEETLKETCNEPDIFPKVFDNGDIAHYICSRKKGHDGIHIYQNMILHKKEENAKKEVFSKPKQCSNLHSYDRKRGYINCQLLENHQGDHQCRGFHWS